MKKVFRFHFTIFSLCFCTTPVSAQPISPQQQQPNFPQQQQPNFPQQQQPNSPQQLPTLSPQQQELVKKRQAFVQREKTPQDLLGTWENKPNALFEKALAARQRLSFTGNTYEKNVSSTQGFGCSASIVENEVGTYTIENKGTVTSNSFGQPVNRSTIHFQIKSRERTLTNPCSPQEQKTTKSENLSDTQLFKMDFADDSFTTKKLCFPKEFFTSCLYQ